MPTPRAPVLLLDDCEADAQMLRRALRPLAPERPVGVVADPDAALRWMEEHGHPGLLGLDWRLGRSTGAEVLAAVRARPACAGWRVVVLSGAELSEADRERARGLGAERVLVKPMDLDGWTAVAAQIVGASAVQGRVTPTLPGGEGRIALRDVPLETMSSHALSLADLAPDLGAAVQAFPAVGDFLARITNALTGCPGVQAPAFNVGEDVTEREAREFLVGCRKHRLTPAQAMGHGQEQIIVVRRHSLIRHLVEQGWSNASLVDYFGIHRNTISRLRCEVTEKAGAAVVQVGS